MGRPHGELCVGTNYHFVNEKPKTKKIMSGYVRHSRNICEAFIRNLSPNLPDPFQQIFRNGTQTREEEDTCWRSQWPILENQQCKQRPEKYGHPGWCWRCGTQRYSTGKGCTKCHGARDCWPPERKTLKQIARLYGNGRTAWRNASTTFLTFDFWQYKYETCPYASRSHTPLSRGEVLTCERCQELSKTPPNEWKGTSYTAAPCHEQFLESCTYRRFSACRP